MKIVRTPLFFGPDERSLFGWFHAPPVNTRRDLAIVLCPPLGHEYVNAHRSVRHLADRLAASGVAALRFDYHGTGDSSGRDEDPGRVAAWIQSVREARLTLHELSGCERIGLVGLRFGALLAALAASESQVACLGLWGPVTRGRSYVRELKALHLTGGRTSDEGQLEPGGFVFTEETLRDLGALEPRTPRTGLIRTFPAPPETFDPPHSAVVPFDTIDAIVQWVGEGTPFSSAPLPVVSPRREQQHDGIRESLVDLHGIFGIVSEPTSGAHGPLVVMPNAGATHHAGPNRLYVLLARSLSRAGFRCLRLDLPGLGDSVLDDPSKENDVYPPNTTVLLERAMRAMQATDCVSMGLCSGAHASFHAALESDAPIVESILINPLTFYYQRGMSLDQPARQYGEWQWYMRSVRRFDRWAKLLRGEVRLRAVLRAVVQRLRDEVGTLRRKRGAQDLDGDLLRLAAFGKRITFVFSRFDPGYDILMFNARPAVRRLRRQGSLKLWRIDDADHTFQTRKSREAMIDSVREHLVQRYPH
jgi:alpha-beta hydrolase superfamily lysophospholipase